MSPFVLYFVQVVGHVLYFVQIVGNAATCCRDATHRSHNSVKP